jgi:CRP/FNR family cyclic AMP-dependent transcriptional regulator
MSLFDPVSTSPSARVLAADAHVVALADVDPDLMRLLSADRLRSACRDLAVRVLTLPRGRWPIDGVAVNATHLGLLVVDGILGRELVADDVTSTELLGPGDLLRPWDEAAESELVEAVVRWTALAPTRLAILDRHVAVRLASYPEVHAALLERCAWRARRLAVLQTIAHLNRVDRRLLTLLWHLAERWGRVTPEGVAVPLALPHSMLGQLVGARRPTVSSALAKLTRDGEVVRGDAGTWILTGRPVGAPAPRAVPSVVPRRSMLGVGSGAVGLSVRVLNVAVAADVGLEDEVLEHDVF